MKMLQNSIVEPRPTSALLAEKERIWRVRLPEEFKQFIMLYNGGTPYEDTFFCKDDGREYAIERFLCILKDFRTNPFGCYDIDVIDAQIGERLTDNGDLIGVDLLPIASTYSDFLCLDFRKDRTNPTVCIWSREESGDFAPVTYYVANGFTEFIRMLSAK